MRRGKRAPIPKIPKRRAERLVLALVRASFHVLRLFPTALSARWAEQLFLTPPRQSLTRSEREILSRGRFRRVRAGSFRVATWRWGEGPAVLLVHGWGGHAGRLARFVTPLAEAGFSVVAFDAPGHGGSEGKQCDLSDFLRALRAVARDCGGVAALIGHSLGASACLLALRDGLCGRAAVLLAPLANPEEYTGRFAKICRMSVAVRDSMKARLATRQRLSWETLRLAQSAPPTAGPLLIFHDFGDLKVPVKNGHAIARAWPRAKLVTTRGLGHHKILRNPEIVRDAVAFLLRRLPTVRRSALRKGPAPSGRSGERLGRVRPRSLAWSLASRFAPVA